MFKNEYAVTRKLYRSWLLEGRFKGKRLFFFVTGCILCAACLGFAIFYIFLSQNLENPSDMIVYIYLFFLYALFFAFYNFVMPYIKADRSYKQYARTVGGENFTRTILFLETEILWKDGPMQRQFEYKDITEIIEKDDLVWILFTNNMGIRFFKSTFVEGDYASCIALIEEKRTAEATELQ